MNVLGEGILKLKRNTAVSATFEGVLIDNA